MDDGKFTSVNDGIFEGTEDVYVRGIGDYKDPVTVYVVNNRNWKCGDDISGMIVASATGPLSDKSLLNLGKFKSGVYDVFVDENGDKKYNCDRCDMEVVDGKALKCFGFEVVPEMVTVGLFAAGGILLVGYARIKRNKQI